MANESSILSPIKKGTKKMIFIIFAAGFAAGWILNEKLEDILGFFWKDKG